MNGPADERSPVAPRRGGRAALQVAGFVIGLALLGWCISTTLKPENLKQWTRLREAPVGLVLALLALSVATVAVNGEVFRRAIGPIKHLRFMDVQAINAAASLLSYLPFKLSLIFRVFAHRRNDGIPILTIAAWLGVVAATMAVTILPPLGASLARGRADPLWWVLTLGGVALLGVAMVTVARTLRAQPGDAWLSGMWKSLRLPAGLLLRVHEGLRMLGEPRAMAACIALRLVDQAVHTGRFLVAARILGFELPADKAVIAGCSYFLIGVVAPSGAIGVREALTGGMLGRLMSGIDPDRFMVAVLMVSAAEAMVLTPAGVMGMAWTRARGRRGRPEQSARD
jgi:hypothetical protein